MQMLAAMGVLRFHFAVTAASALCDCTAGVTAGLVSSGTGVRCSAPPVPSRSHAPPAGKPSSPPEQDFGSVPQRDAAGRAGIGYSFITRFPHSSLRLTAGRT